MFDLVITEDGSLSCADPENGELYHNRAGAYTEALVNYVEPSAAETALNLTGRLCVLDACFGLGYNSWVLLQKLLERRLCGDVHVLAIEANPEIVPLSFNILEDKRLDLVRNALSRRGGRGAIGKQGTLQFELEILIGDLRREVLNLGAPLDLVFHDPFSPARGPMLWTTDLFVQYRRLLAQREGRLLTYSSATAVRAGLIEAGFSVFRTPAVGGKSGGTLAATGSLEADNRLLFNLSAEEKGRISSRSGIPYRDPDLGDSSETILRRREQELRLRT